MSETVEWYQEVLTICNSIPNHIFDIEETPWSMVANPLASHIHSRVEDMMNGSDESDCYYPLLEE